MLTLGSFLMGSINVWYTIWLGVRLCYVDGVDRNRTEGRILGKLQDTCFDIGIGNYVMFVWVLSGSEFTHLTMASFLFVIALVVKCLHAKLATLLEQILDESITQGENDQDGFAYKDLKYRGMTKELDFEMIRLVYEKLNETVIHIRKFFGVPCLVICCDGILTCVFGFYWRIIYYENLPDEDGHSADIYNLILFSMHFLYSVMSLLLILISGHIMATTALDVPKVIRKAKLSHLNSSARFQVSLLLQVSAGFPTKFTVYSITNLEMPFLAAATTNVITYLLVLMQFRMEQTSQGLAHH
ncbi:uncharacterized protein LOC118433546 [Folsomia candida]|nr:uncharacterized protein LOC118433546 [Folsomia candida]